ncbi:MAG TPA: AMP-binding protein, partial [Chitinophagaceae bacterium]|nr:AMP-binding protein [Chitinophagaceae bacterium]
MQCVYRRVKLPIEVFDYRALSRQEQEAAVKEYEEADRRKGYDFKEAPLMRIALMQLDEERYRMVLSWHHILLDGWSLSVLMGEFLSVYNALLKGEAVEKNDEDKYEDYIRFIENRDKEQEEEHWLRYMKGLEGPTLLPFIGATPERTRGIGAYGEEWLEMDNEVAIRLEAFAQRNRITVNTVMQAAWAYILHKYTGKPDVAYGIVVSGRPDELPGVERRVGMYINTIPLHTTVSSEQDVVSWLHSIQSGQVLCREYQYVALHNIQEWIGIKGDLFDTSITFQNYPVSEAVSAGPRTLRIEEIDMKPQTNFPLSLVILVGREVTVIFSYNKSLLSQELVKEIAGHFRHVLLQLINDAGGKLGDMTLVTADEKQKLIVDFNNRHVQYPAGKTIVQLFEEQVNKTPEAPALVYLSQQLTYRELDERANQLAHHLRSKGVKKETLVAICIERSLEMMISILGILKAGGAYVPIDPGYPRERIAYMLQDTAAPLVITSNEYVHSLQDVYNGTIVQIDREWNQITAQPTTNVINDLTADHLAYVIYTSGSTGKPKGVLIEHRSVVNLILYQSGTFGITPNERILQFSDYCFDASVEQMFLALCNGAALVLIYEGLQLDIYQFEKFLEEQQITHLHATPGFLENITPGKYAGLKRVIAGGELCKKELALKWQHDVEFYNEYGPTETTVTAIEYSCAGNDLQRINVLPIGKALANTFVYILDAAGDPVP